MNLEIFFEKFDLVADMPDAVAKMREVVLQMAVQGRLVEQSPNEGSAGELLAEIPLTRSPDFDWTAYEPVDPPLAALPINWRWAPTSLLCDLQTGKRMKGGAQETGVISLGGEHLKPDGTVDYSVPRYVSRQFYDEMPKGKVHFHDTLMVKDGATTGKAAFVASMPEDGLAAVNEHVFILRWHEPIEKRFAFYFIRAFALTHIATKSAGLIGGIRREAVLDFPFPLPPLAEQKRIVAKIDELMALCDRLEAQQQERETRHVVLARASLARFADAPTPANLDFNIPQILRHRPRRPPQIHPHSRRPRQTRPPRPQRRGRENASRET
jgi:type I restriction enzyme, S subunit